MKALDYKRLLATTILASLLGAAPFAANAIQVFGTDVTGATTLLSTTWTVNPGTPAGGAAATDVSGGAGTDWEVLVGLGDFGDAQGDTQAQAIYGAGTTVEGVFTKVDVVFDVAAFSWDSYDAIGTPAPGSTGYWDAFAVNINDTNYYWNLALGDPIVSPDPAGSPINSNDAGSTSNIDGETWAWGALDFGNNTFESEIGTHTLSLVAAPGEVLPEFLFISAVLDTLTLPQSDTAYPSWGCFNVATTTDCPEPTVIPTPEPGTLLLLGLGLAGAGIARRRRRSI